MAPSNSKKKIAKKPPTKKPAAKKPAAKKLPPKNTQLTPTVEDFSNEEPTMRGGTLPTDGDSIMEEVDGEDEESTVAAIEMSDEEEDEEAELSTHEPTEYK
jgi:hypothetical protein